MEKFKNYLKIILTIVVLTLVISQGIYAIKESIRLRGEIKERIKIAKWIKANANERLLDKYYNGKITVESAKKAYSVGDLAILDYPPPVEVELEMQRKLKEKPLESAKEEMNLHEQLESDYEKQFGITPTGKLGLRMSGVVVDSDMNVSPDIGLGF